MLISNLFSIDYGGMLIVIVVIFGFQSFSQILIHFCTICAKSVLTSDKL